jgi:hypothetical protein
LVPEGACDLPPKVEFHRMQHPERKLGEPKGPAVRRFIAFALALSILSSGLSGCSQPIDPGSSVPAASQPIVALLALVGLGIGLTAWHHHNENHGSGSGGTPPLFGAQFMIAPFILGYKPVSLVVDSVNLTLGAVLVPTGGGAGKFTEIQETSTSASTFGTYTLPTGYAPTAVAMDSNGITWFVDGAGTVQACDTMTTLTTACSSLGVFSDGLGAGSRSIAADTNFVIVVMDGGAGLVKWWVFPTATSSTANSGTYSSTTTSPIFATDAIESTATVSPSSFAVYHQDGTSDVVTFTASGSTVTVNSQPSYLYKPATLVAPSNFEQESLAVAFFSFTGAPGGAYSLSKYEAANPVGLGNPKVTSQLIAFNGQLSPTGAQFRAPLFSIRADVNENSIWAIDQAGDIVNFSPF